MDDPNFRRAVVLLCEHGAEGSFGLILNRPLTLELGELVAGVASTETVSLGGPVQQNTLHFLHRHGDRVSDAIPVVDGVLWGGDFEAIKDLLGSNGATPHDLRFFLGYAGWSPGQLLDEIEQGGWILTPAEDDLVFDAAPATLWRTVMRRMGGEYALLSNYPDDPRLN
ncbi:MAG: YqgE/AlgH family protein [Rhodothermales bacterium]|nr:YqgE/AlgH family protein [Rhodothermales bacterium]